ncbi:hypothetical protein [uncultured Paludibaculum sp.]|uniref:hypothetical protein n=1 Tax=uncultured Paludibaculum sp. TaxID=1765020 RepID=UPI002AAB7B57|nr:hypothetical protein [uncultured Paludibaculum sp.]
MRGLLCFLLAVLPLPAQTVGSYLPESLITYLQLTEAQSQKILDNNSTYSTLVTQKNHRIYEVQLEIATETAKESLDSSALGVRYMEIELICRDIKKAGETLLQDNAGLLMETQKARLSALEEALKLAPLISQGQSANLLPGAASVRSGDFSALVPVFGVSWTTASGCPKPGPVFGIVTVQPRTWPCRDASCADAKH